MVDLSLWLSADNTAALLGLKDGAPLGALPREQPDKLYRGWRPDVGPCTIVIVEGARERPLAPRLDLANHSPTGFGFGYGGSGPSQLALALCADALGDDARALELYQEFKWRAVACVQGAAFEISAARVREICAEIDGPSH